MTESQKRKEKIRIITMGAVLTALVIILQFMGAFIRFGVFSVSLVLVPIVIGAATCSVGVSAWLGFVFGTVVLLSGDAAPFMSINMAGTVITVLAKGTACGFAAGAIYKLISRWNSFWGVLGASLVCPIVNTGIFLLGCWIFFLDGISAWGTAAGFSNVTAYMFLGLAGGNFIFELVTNLVLGPAVSTAIKAIKK